MSSISTTPSFESNPAISPSFTASGDSAVTRLGTPDQSVSNVSLDIRKAEVSTALTLLKTAGYLARSGHSIKALHYIKQAARDGNAYANLVLHNNKACTIHNDRKQPIQKINIAQAEIKIKMSQFLVKLSESNPAYNMQLIESIECDLIRGHCHGFSIHYGQLSLEQENRQDLTHTYARLMCKIAEWDGTFFEPPHGFNYRTYKAGDKQGLSPEQEAQMLKTDEIKQLIQMVRYAQQSLNEAFTWVDEKTLQRMNRTNIPLHNQDNLQGILGKHYIVKEKIESWDANFSVFSDLALSLEYNLKENNAALFSFNTSVADHSSHIITIIFRENQYYMMDSNSTSLEKNYDDRYSAISFNSPQALLADIINRYMKNPPIANHHKLTLSYFEKRETKNKYVKRNNLKIHDTITKLGKLSDHLGEDLFHEAFPLESSDYKIAPHMTKILHDKKALDLLIHPNIVEIDCRDIDIELKDCTELRSMIENCPQATILVNDKHHAFLRCVYYVLGCNFQNGDKTKFIAPNEAQAIQYFQQASRLGDHESKYQLAQFHKKKGNYIDYLGLLDEIIAQKEYAPALYERGRAYKLGTFGSKIDLSKHIDLMKRAAALSHPHAQFEVANYELATNKNTKLWFENMNAASNMGVRNANYMLGMAYMEGANNLEKNLYIARDLFERAQPIPDALEHYVKVDIEILTLGKEDSKLFQEGTIYRFGINRSKNIKIALQYFKAAESLGNKIAATVIAHMYKNKEIIAENPSEYLTAILKIEDKISKYRMLASAYLTGDIFQKDLKRARYWFNCIPADKLNPDDTLKSEIEEAERLENTTETTQSSI